MKEHCATCRHHSMEKRARIVNGDLEEGAAELGLFPTHDGSASDVERFGPEQFEKVYRCAKQDLKQVGIGDDAGVGCPMWEAGRRVAAPEVTMFRTPRPDRE